MTEIYADRPVLLSAGTANIYVYCDLLKHVMVGDIKAPLLRSQQNDGRSMSRRDSRTYRLQSDTVRAAAEKVFRHDRHPTGDGRRKTAAVCVRQGDSCVGVSSDGASISTAIKGRMPDRRWSVTIGRDEEKNVTARKIANSTKTITATMPVCVGRHYQRGYGLAQMIGGLFNPSVAMVFF